MFLRLSTAAFFRYVGLVRSRYARFFYYVHRHQLITHGGLNRRRTCIDILDDDSLLNIFYLYRLPVLLEEGDSGDIALWGGRWEWEDWWYKLASVCRRWRYLILASPSYLGISLVCRSLTPMADMLAHSPHFPLVINHFPPEHRKTTTQVKEGILLALKQRDRVRRIRLQMHDPPSIGFVEALDEEFPLLEYLHIQSQMVRNTNLSLPSTLRAPRLRHLVLHGFTFPIGSPSLAGLVTLSFECKPSANFGPNTLLQQLSLMPHLETFKISFHSTFTNMHVERQLFRIPLSTYVTLPSLRWFGFEGPSAFIGIILPRMTMPLLKVTEIASTTSDLRNLATSIPLALRSMCETESPRLYAVKVAFYDENMVVTMHPHKQDSMPTLRLRLLRSNPTAGLECMAQVFHLTREVFTEVASLTFEDKTSWVLHRRFAIHASWHELLRPFNQVRTLRVSGGDLIEVLSLSLLPIDGESAIGLLPMLGVLSCPKGSQVGESCVLFLDTRRNAGFPVTISHH